MTFGEWEAKAKLLGVYDEFDIKITEKYGLSSISDYMGREAFIYELVKYKGKHSTVVIPPVDIVGREAFYGNKNIKNVKFTKDVTVIYPGAFLRCTNLESVDMEDTSIQRIQDGVFEGCTHLKNVKLPKDLKLIGVNAFKYCTELERLNLPNGLEIICEHAFHDSGLNNMIIPESVKFIGESAWHGCVKLKELYILSELLYNSLEDDELPFNGIKYKYRWDSNFIGKHTDNLELIRMRKVVYRSMLGYMLNKHTKLVEFII